MIVAVVGLLAACEQLTLPAWFEATSYLALEINGVLDVDGQVCYAATGGTPLEAALAEEHRAKLLIVSSRLPRPIVTDGQTRSVLGLPLRAVKSRPGGRFQVIDRNARPLDYGRFTVEKPNPPGPNKIDAISFVVGKTRYRIVKRPILVGWVTFRKLRQHRFEARGVSADAIDKQAVSQLKKLKRLRLDVYFVDHHLSREYKALANVSALAAHVGKASLEVRFCALPLNFAWLAKEPGINSRVCAAAVRKGVRGTLTGFLMRDGKQVASLSKAQLTRPALSVLLQLRAK